MAESSLTQAYADIRRQLGRYLGYGRSSGGWSSDEAQDIVDCFESGLRRTYFPVDPRNGRGYRWSWLFKEAEIDTVEPYSTGTVQVETAADAGTTGSKVTLSGTGAVWPSWAADGELQVSGVSYTVRVRTSDTVIELDDTGVTVAAGTDYKLGQHRYNLPDDFLALDSPLTYRSGEADYYPELVLRNESDIRKWRQSYEYFYYPLAAAVVPRSFDGTVGQRFDILLGPTPDRELRLLYRYVRLPNTIDGTDVYHAGGASISELVLTAALAEADLKLNDGGRGIYEQRFREELAAAIQMDRIATSVNVHGYNGDPDESRDYYSSASAIYMDYARQLESVDL